MRTMPVSLYTPSLKTTPVRKTASIRLENFRPITLADMPIIWKYLQLESGRTTDFSYGGLLMWVHYFNYEYAIVQDTLFIKGVVENHREVPAFSMPVGKLPLAESIALIRDYCDRKGIKAELSAVPEYAMDEIILLNPNKVEELEDWADYLYEAETLATLRGKKMGKKRNHVNKFNTLYPDWKLEELNSQNAKEAMLFMDKFDLEGDKNQQAADERKLTREMIACIEMGDKRSEGVILKVGDKIAGFSIGDVKGDTLYVHIEKCTRDFDGSYEKINQEFARLMTERYPQIKYINREDDGGDEGLRYAKQSYHPIDKLRKFNVIF